MSHPFGDLVSQHLHRKHGLSQAKLAEGILQDPAVIGKMCKGDRIVLLLYKDKAAQLQAEIEAGLPADVRSAARFPMAR